MTLRLTLYLDEPELTASEVDEIVDQALRPLDELEAGATVVLTPDGNVHHGLVLQVDRTRWEVGS